MSFDAETLDERLGDVLREVADSISLATDPVVGLRPRAGGRPASRHTVLTLVAAVAAALVVTGVWADSRRSAPRVDVSAGLSPASTVPPQPKTKGLVAARLDLPSRTIAAGSSMVGRVVVDNDTRHALHVGGCGSLFAVALASDTYHPDVLWRLCLQPFTIPTGQSSYPVTIEARYLWCSANASQAVLRACRASGQPPALPPGNYQARLYQSSTIVATPPSVPVRVTRQRSTP
jgi:hypothetical protein